MPETTPLIKAALNLRVGAGFDVYVLLRTLQDIFVKIQQQSQKKSGCTGSATGITKALFIMQKTSVFIDTIAVKLMPATNSFSAALNVPPAPPAIRPAGISSGNIADGWIRLPMSVTAVTKHSINVPLHISMSMMPALLTANTASFFPAAERAST